jgi:hypothetical protein
VDVKMVHGMQVKGEGEALGLGGKKNLMEKLKRGLIY